MELTQLRTIVEGALLAAGQPMNLNRIKGLFEVGEEPETDDLKAALDAIAADCEGRGFELKEVGSGWRFQVRTEVAPWINRLWEEKPQKYSRALLETLALVAYRQPITRGDIEEIRGVAVSSHIIKTLSEREWIKVVGHRDVPGRPSLYATTRQFLDYFNLKSLDELPSLGEIRDLSDMNPALDLDGSDSMADDAEEPSAEGDTEPSSEGDTEPSAERDIEPTAVKEDPSSVEEELSALGDEPSLLDEEPPALGEEPSAIEKEQSSPDEDENEDPDYSATGTEHYAGSMFDSDDTNDADAEPRSKTEADQSSL